MVNKRLVGYRGISRSAGDEQDSAVSQHGGLRCSGEPKGQAVWLLVARPLGVEFRQTLARSSCLAWAPVN
jgi:hypothetical protein